MYLQVRSLKIAILVTFLYSLQTIFSIALACTSPVGVEGQMQWIAASSVVRYCNGTSWVSMDNTLTATSCSSIGAIQFVSSEIMFCNGSVWVKTSPATNHGACIPAEAGRFYYDTTGKFYWFCSGTNWKRMGP